MICTSNIRLIRLLRGWTNLRRKRGDSSIMALSNSLLIPEISYILPNMSIKVLYGINVCIVTHNDKCKVQLMSNEWTYASLCQLLITVHHTSHLPRSSLRTANKTPFSIIIMYYGMSDLLSSEIHLSYTFECSVKDKLPLLIIYEFW